VYSEDGLRGRASDQGERCCRTDQNHSHVRDAAGRVPILETCSGDQSFELRDRQVGAQTPGVATPTAIVPGVGGSTQPRQFRNVLAAIVLSGLAIRVVYVLLVTRHEHGKFYDAFWYALTGSELAHGQFFRDSFLNQPTASHPPLTSVLLAPASLVFGVKPGLTPQRLTMVVLGTAVILCVGLLGRAVAGPWVGLTAAGLAAVAPNFWIPNGILMSETLAMLLMVLILLAVVRVLRAPTFGNAALLGAAIGFEALVRAELILFLPCLLLPAALAARNQAPMRRLALFGVGALVTLVVLTPWVGRNLVVFKDPTYLSTGIGGTLLGSNCPQVYSGPDIGGWNVVCSAQTSGSDESVQSSRATHAAIQFADRHSHRVPLVVLARVARLWDVIHPIRAAREQVGEGRPLPEALAGLGFYYLLIPLGVAGVVILRRRRLHQWFLLVPAGALTLVSAAFFGQTRFRAPFEVCLVVLAAPALVLLAQRLFQRRTNAQPADVGPTDSTPIGEAFFKN